MYTLVTGLLLAVSRMATTHPFLWALGRRTTRDKQKNVLMLLLPAVAVNGVYDVRDVVLPRATRHALERGAQRRLDVNSDGAKRTYKYGRREYKHNPRTGGAGIKIYPVPEDGNRNGHVLYLNMSGEISTQAMRTRGGRKRGGRSEGTRGSPG